MDDSMIELLKSGRKNEIEAYLATNPNSFGKIFNIALSEEEKICWRSAWLISSTIKHNDKRLATKRDLLIAAIEGKKDGHQRELLRILLQLELEDDQEGLLFDKCLSLWENISNSSSLRITAFKFIMKTLNKYPELVEEVDFFTDEHYLKPLSPGIRHSVIQLITRFKKANSNI